MHFDDPVYGDVVLEHPLLERLACSPSMDRMRGVSQVGYAGPWTPQTDYTRFEHSVGVCALLGRFGASLEEQAAGLLHDVSHTALSHCVDYAVASGSEAEQSFQDSSHARFVLASELPSILNFHGLDPERVIELGHFGLLEQPLPALCADRIDYVLRTGVHSREIDRRRADQFVSALGVHKGRFLFVDVNLGEAFARFFSHINDRYYSDFNSAAMFRSTGDVLRHSLAKGYLSMSELFACDADVLHTLTARLADDPALDRLWRRMRNEVRVVKSSYGEGVRVLCKSRAIDPLCRTTSGPKPLSDIVPDWARAISLSLYPRVHWLKFLD